MCIFSCNISKCSFKFLIRYVNTTIVNLQHHNFSSFRCTVCLQSYGQVKELSVTMFPTACSLSQNLQDINTWTTRKLNIPTTYYIFACCVAPEELYKDLLLLYFIY